MGRSLDECGDNGRIHSFNSRATTCAETVKATSDRVKDVNSTVKCVLKSVNGRVREV